MQITDTPAQPIERIQIDILGPLPLTPGENKYILTIQDNFSKFQKDAATVAAALAEQFIFRYGCPLDACILSDRMSKIRFDSPYLSDRIFSISHSRKQIGRAHV